MGINSDVFKDEEAREAVREVYAGLGKAIEEVANNIRTAGKYTIEATLSVTEEYADEKLNCKVLFTKNEY